MNSDEVAIALRPQRAYPAARWSLFEDPADERSAHGSQRYAALSGFYAGREPRWYANTISELAGLRSVLDLGAGPGLTLQALRAAGVADPVGVDRWPAFVRDAEEMGERIVAHDLTLPMPFFASERFDGIFSHFALDYVSPIGLRQVAREAYRLLEPNGRVLFMLARTGLGAGDHARTARFGPEPLRAIFTEAGFSDYSVEPVPEGRNIVARARRERAEPAAPAHEFDASRGLLRVEAGGEVQLSAALDDGVTGVCMRAVRTGRDAYEMQTWTWHGSEPAPVETKFVAGVPAELVARLPRGATPAHLDVWRPELLEAEPGADAYAVDPAREAPRRVLVQQPGQPLEPLAAAAEADRSTFVIARGPVEQLDELWLAGLVHGIASEDPSPAELEWAERREAVVYLDGAELPRGTTCPLVVVDPGLHGAEAREGVAAVLAANDNVYCVTTSGRIPVLLSETGEDVHNRLLAGSGGSGAHAAAPPTGENLRYLTDRMALAWLRETAPRRPAEVGRI